MYVHTYVLSTVCSTDILHTLCPCPSLRRKTLVQSESIGPFSEVGLDVDPATTPLSGDCWPEVVRRNQVLQYRNCMYLSNILAASWLRGLGVDPATTVSRDSWPARVRHNQTPSVAKLYGVRSTSYVTPLYSQLRSRPQCDDSRRALPPPQRETPKRWHRRLRRRRDNPSVKMTRNVTKHGVWRGGLAIETGAHRATRVTEDTESLAPGL